MILEGTPDLDTTSLFQPFTFAIPGSAAGQTWILDIEAEDVLGQVGRSNFSVAIGENAYPEISADQLLYAGVSIPVDAVNSVLGIEILRGNAVSIPIQASDDLAVAAVSISINGEEAEGYDFFVDSVYRWETTNLPLGTYRFEIAATDSIGQATTRFFIVRLVSDAAPEGIVIAPAPGQVIPEGLRYLSLSALVRDNSQVVQVEFLVDGQILDTIDGGFGVVGFDSNGELAYFDSRVESGMQAMGWRGIDFLPGAADNAYGPYDLVLLETDFQVPVGVFASGQTVEIGLRITDNQGNVGLYFHEVLVIEDTQKPQFTLGEPVAGQSYIAGALVDFNLRAADDAAVERIAVWSDVSVSGSGTELDFSGGIPFLSESDIEPIDALPGTVNVIDTPLYELTLRLPETLGERFFGIEVLDINGQQTRGVVGFYIVEDEPPTLDILQPEPGSFVPQGAFLGVQAVATDDLSVDRVVFTVVDDDGLPFPDIEPFIDTIAPYGFSFTIPETSDERGVLKIAASAVDSGGQVTHEPAVTIYSRTDFPPSISLSNPVNGQAIFEGMDLLIQASAGDDIEVRSVTFTVDGQPIATDLTAPFEVFWNVPFDRVGDTLILGAIA